MAKTVKPVRMRGMLSESSEPLNMMSTPEINNYLKTIKKSGGDRPLSREEERELLERYHRDGDVTAKQTLMKHNQLFVYKMVREKCKYQEKLMDCVMQANLALSKAIDKYSLDRKERLSTYATLWITKELWEYIYGTEQGQVKKDHGAQIGANLNKCEQWFLQHEQRYPTIEEIEQWLWEKRKLRVPREELIQASHASCDQSAGTDDDGNSYTIADKGSMSTIFASRNGAEDTMENEEMMAKIQELLDSLDARSREIVEKTFGIGKYDYEWDDEDIADSLGLTKTRIQQIRRAALAQMKNL
jgi:RNA polymerase sigma factor (sigma-70 family)